MAPPTRSRRAPSTSRVRNWTFLGNFAANQTCLQIVADQVKYTGSAVFQNNCAGTGVKDLTTVGNIKLVE